MMERSTPRAGTDPPIDNTIPTTKIYGEDDYFAELNANNYRPKCVSALQKNPESPLPFNYFRFNEYLQAKSHIERVNRAVDASKGIISPGLEYYTDEILYEELCEIYGDLDEENTSFLLIFQNYKEQRVEQITTWVEEDKSTSTGQNQSVLKLSTIVEEEYLQEHFSKEELESFKAVATEEKSNPFQLPKKVVASTADAKMKVQSAAPGRKVNRNKNKGHLTQRNEQIISEVKTIISGYPMGITRNKLLQMCNERLGRKASPEMYLALNSEMIDGVLTKEKILFTKNFFQEGGMVFPGQKQPTVANGPDFFPTELDPLEFLWNFRHKVLTILNLSLGIIEVSECFDLHSKIFQQSPFLFQNWGFDTEIDLMRYLFVQKWSATDVELIHLNLGGKGKSGSGAKYYLAVMTDARRKLVESLTVKRVPAKSYSDTHKMKIDKQKHSSQSTTETGSSLSHKTGYKKFSSVVASASSTQQKTPSTVSSSHAVGSAWNKHTPTLVQKPPNKPPILNYDPTTIVIDYRFVQFGDKIIREQDEIAPGSQFDCVVSLTDSPTNFYLVRMAKWRQLDCLFGNLKEYWNDHTTALSPHPQFLQRGFLCMAQTDEDGDVYRVVVFGNADAHHYQVFCFDYGDILVVRHDQLRYLPKDLLYRLDAQAIPCALYNVASPTKNPATGYDVWSKDVCEYSKELFCPASNDCPTVKALFKQRIQGTGRWLIKAGWGKRPDFGADIMKFVNKGKS